MTRVCFDGMDDDRVLEGVEGVVKRSNEITAELLEYLIEVEKRGLHLKEACSSMFAFCTQRLHLSESAAGKRITAQRVARRFPLVLEMIATGEIHLSAVNLVAAHLTEENHVELLGRARHLSKREVEKLVAEIAPRPDLPSRVSALPGRRAAALPGRRGAAPAVEQTVAVSPASAAALEVHAPGRVPALVAPLSPKRYQIRVTVDEETHATLVRLQDLLSHQIPDRDPAVIISRALELLLEQTLARNVAATKKPRAAKAAKTRNRHIPAAVRREVWQRDGGQCAFVDQKGRRCSATAFLEYHHVRNWARGAEHDPSEIELRCSGHNQYQAALDYGADLIAARRNERERLRSATPCGRGAAPTASREQWLGMTQ
jgi:choline dehydrogenase-like flavoprotein